MEVDGVGVVWVEVEDCDACPGGVALRFKLVEGAGGMRAIEKVAYESDDGLSGLWKVSGVASADEGVAEAARAGLVEDSSEGTTLLIVGGAYGLRLEHEASGRVVREAYLVMAKGTWVG